MQFPNKQYWFRLKRFGIGSEPVTWQGWLVVLIYVAAMFSSCVLMLPTHSPGRLVLTLVGLTVVLHLIVAIKGEPRE